MGCDDGMNVQWNVVEWGVSFVGGWNGIVNNVREGWASIFCFAGTYVFIKLPVQYIHIIPLYYPS